MKQFIYVLKLSPILIDENNWTEKEQNIVNEHFKSLQRLLKEGKLILAGKTEGQDEKTFGIVIFEAETYEEAYELMKNDPAVKQGVMTAELYPYNVALLREPMVREKSCGGIIFQKKENTLEYLLVQMTRGHWSFPKGHVENNESELETARREIKEETNVDVQLLSDFKEVVSYSPKPNVMKDVVYFLGTPLSTNVIRQEAEIKTVRWVKEDEVKELLTYDNDQKLFDKAQAYIHKNKIIKK